MSERASVFEGVQIGVETSPGTGGTADLIMEAFGWLPSKQGKVETFRPEGMKYTTISSTGKQHTKWKIDGILDYVNVLYLLRGLMHMEADPVQQGATTAYLWTFTSQTSDADENVTYQIERGSSVKAARYAYNLVTGLGFSFGAEDAMVKLSGEAIGQKPTRGITMTTPTTGVAAVPALPGHFVVKYATTKAGLSGASAMTRLLALEWGNKAKSNPVFNISASPSYVAHAEIAPALDGSLTVEADTEGEAIETYAEAATPLWLNIKATGGLIATPYYYYIDITMPFVAKTLGDASDSNGVWALKFGIDGRHDAVDGKAIEIKVMSIDVAALHV